MSDKIKVLVADSSFLTRQGLMAVVKQDAELELIGGVFHEDDLFERLEECDDCILLIDYQNSDTIQACTIEKIQKKYPKAKMVILSQDQDKKTIYKIIESGIPAFLTKECGEDEIRNAITAASKGENFFCNKILNLILKKSFYLQETCDAQPLTPREIEMVQSIAQGKIAKEIADEFHLSTHTVYTHRKTIFKKLQINSTAELVLYAIKNELIPQPS